MTIKKRITKKTLKIDRNAMPLLLNEKQAADMIGVSVSYLRKSRSKGVLKHSTPPPLHVNVEGRVFYPQCRAACKNEPVKTKSARKIDPLWSVSNSRKRCEKLSPDF